MTKKELKEQAKEYADASIKYVAQRVPWLKANWQLLVIAALLVCALFAFWRWQVHAAEAERLGRLVEVGATIAKSEKNLAAINERIAAREAQIEAATEEYRRLGKELQDLRAARKKASAARVALLSNLNAKGVADELTKLGFPASPVMK